MRPSHICAPRLKDLHLWGKGEFILKKYTLQDLRKLNKYRTFRRKKR